MRNKITTLILCGMVGMSCTKDEISTDNKVEYIIKCNECQVTMDVLGGSKIVYVKGYFVRAEINTLPIINVITDGDGDISVKIKIDNKEAYNKTNTQVAGTPIKHTIKR